MNKRKIMMLALAVMMIAILAIGGTLAYFTAENGADNVFTMGGVDVELEENFPDDPPELKPGLDIGKEVYAKNVGQMGDAYVRVHIAIRSDMDDGNPNFEAVNNFLHFNFKGADYADGLWSWKKEYTDGPGYESGMKDWNFYEMEIPEVYGDKTINMKYNVYVATYRPALKPGEETTGYAMTKVYLDPSVECTVERAVDADGNYIVEDGKYVPAAYIYTDSHGNTVRLTPEETQSIKIKVWAEATQTDPFANAYDALNTVFGVPGTYNPWIEE